MSDLPRGWARTTLGVIGKYLNGRGFKRSEWRDAGRPIIRIQNLTGTSRAHNYFDGEADSSHVARAGDILVSWAATLGVFVWDGPEAVVNQHIFKVQSHIDSKFHRYLLESVLGDLRRQAHGSGMVHITKSRFENTPVMLPPTREQVRIVAAIEEQLSRLDAGVALLRRAKEGLAQLSRAVLWSAFPSDWPTRPLVELTDPLRPICYGILKPKTVGALVVPYVEVRSIQNGRIEIDGLHKTTQELHEEFRRSELCTGDVVLAIRGSYDRAAVVPPELMGGNVSRDVARIAPKSMLDSGFLAYYLGGPHAAAFFSRAARGVGVRGVNIGDLRKMPVPVPSHDQQKRAVAQIERALSVIAAMTIETDTALYRARTLRRSILEQAFSGGLVHQDPRDEPASALLEGVVANRESSGGLEPAKAHSQSRRKATV